MASAHVQTGDRVSPSATTSSYSAEPPPSLLRSFLRKEVVGDAALASDRSSRSAPPIALGHHDSADVDAPRNRLALFLSEGAPLAAICLWLGWEPRIPSDLERARLQIERDIATIDSAVSQQVNALLHHPDFQKLEASWRSLVRLVEVAGAASDSLENNSPQGRLSVRVLNASKRDLLRDVRGALEFDQSALWRKVYEEEFGILGGHPYGLLIGDYSFSRTPDDLELLRSLSGIAAASFAPFVAAAAPELLGIDDYSLLELPLDLAGVFQRLDYLEWRSFRAQLDSRFVALTVPRVLVRRPYQSYIDAGTRFSFREEADDRSKYVWGNAAYAFATIVMRAYAASGWFADIRGAHRGAQTGGLVAELPVDSFSTDPHSSAIKMSTEVAIAEFQERELHAVGLMPLCDTKDGGLAAFFTNQSLYQPRTLDNPVATANERMNSMLQYTLCASRFAHYLKVLMRQKLGNVANVERLEDELNEWMMKYVNPDEHASPSVKARYPLREAQVKVVEVAGSPGEFNLVMHLCPHYQLDQMTGNLRLETRVWSSA